jgi:hypothetical protein
MSPSHEVIIAASNAILETIKEAGEDGAPSGALYMACQEFGIPLDIYQGMIELFLKHGWIRQSHHVLYWVEARKCK